MKGTLDKEEKEILEAYENGQLLPVKSSNEIASRLRAAARNTLIKAKRGKLREKATASQI